MKKKTTQHLELDLDFKRNIYKGRYVVLEGIDGSGKTVQSANIVKFLEDKKEEVVWVTEPRRTGPIGELIDKLLHKKVKLPPESLQFLFVADRIAHQEEVIIPALKQGKDVVSHRNFWSALPYGIMYISKGEIMDSSSTLLVAQCILSTYFQVMVPDITFYLDVPAKVALERLNHAGVKKEYYETKDKLTKVKEAYEWIINKYPDEFVRINGDQPIEKVTSDIIKYL